jgi:hypothetical protein
MKKIILLVLLIATLSVSGVFAEDGGMFTSYAPGIVDTGTKLFINTGVAWGFFPLYTKGVIPPLEASIEVALPIPLSFGGFFAYAQGKTENAINYSYALADQIETAMTFGGRMSYHVNLGVKNLDTYASLSLGWLVWTLKYDWKKGKQSEMGFPSLWGDTDYSQFFYDVRLGLRYFFINNVGVYAEVGYNVISIIGVGLSFKF